VISSGKATLLEMREKYYLEDVYNIIEIISVDTHNRLVAIEQAKKEKD
jgi:hypothetical protein